jgi:hypothetical protein
MILRPEDEGKLIPRAVPLSLSIPLSLSTGILTRCDAKSIKRVSVGSTGLSKRSTSRDAAIIQVLRRRVSWPLEWRFLRG